MQEPTTSTTSCDPAPELQLTHQEVLEKWLGACAANPWGALTPEASTLYRVIWTAWGKHLGSTPWHDASAVQALGFINSIGGYHADTPSDISRRRYWRLLDRVYEFAQLHGICTKNPAQEIAPEDRPPVEFSEGAILSPRMWGALPDSFPKRGTASAVRDKAILSMLVDTGMAARDLAKLQLCDLQLDGQGQCIAVHIQSPRKYENRTISIDPQTNTHLQAWLAVRHQFTMAMDAPWVFVSQNKAAKLSNSMLWPVVTKHLLYCAHINKLPEPPRAGPQVIRNTAIVRWLLCGMDVYEVAKRAGLKNLRGLAHLRAHLPAHIRLNIASSCPD